LDRSPLGLMIDEQAVEDETRRVIAGDDVTVPSGGTCPVDADIGCKNLDTEVHFEQEHGAVDAKNKFGPDCNELPLPSKLCVLGVPIQL